MLFVETRVVDADLRDVPPGELGEVVYRSPQLCTGYWDKPEETAEAFAGGWFHSGDLVRSDDEGYIFVVDRIKDVINTGGVLVASREVEDALYAHPAVAEVAVVGLPHERWIEAITAVVVLKEDVEPQALIDYAKGRLAPHKVPKSVHPVDELPKNASGKVLKRELRAPARRLRVRGRPGPRLGRLRPARVAALGHHRRQRRRPDQAEHDRQRQPRGRVPHVDQQQLGRDVGEDRRQAQVQEAEALEQPVEHEEQAHHARAG